MTLSRFLLLEEKGNLTSAEWLAGTPRQVLDWRWMFEQLYEQRNLGRIEKDESDDRLLAKLLDDVQRQAREEWRLPYAEREKLADMLDTPVNISLNLERYLRIEQKPPYMAQELKKLAHGTFVDNSPTSFLDVSVVTAFLKLASYL